MKNAAYMLPFLLAAALLAGSCGKREESPRPVPQQVDLQLRAVWGGAASRTELGPVGGGAPESEQEVRWSVGDRIAVWAFDAETGAVQLDRTLFTFATYNADYASADFRATAGEMPVGTYTYYAFYPAEAATGAAAGGTAFDLKIPAVQTGDYDPAADLMAATATGARLPAVGSSHPSAQEPPQLAFRHLTHLLRIEIPGGRNRLGREIKRLEITFPREVAGRVAFDAAHPEAAALADGTRTVTLDFPDDRLLTESTPEAPRYAWVYIWPGDLEGEIAFRAYDTAGVPSEATTAAVSKSAAAQRITPVRLTVPPSPFSGITYIELDPAVNFLGEELTSLTLSGHTFVKPFTTETTETLAVAPTAAGSFRFAVCKPAAEVAGTELGVTYESEHALLENRALALPGTLTPAGDYCTVPFTVPYLFEENFDQASGASRDGNNDKDMLDQHNVLGGWSAARYSISAGKAIRISAYLASSLYTDPDHGDNHRGRLDTPFLPLKKAAKITVSYRVAGTRDKALVGNRYTYAKYQLGLDTQSGAIAGTNVALARVAFEESSRSAFTYDGSYTNIPDSRSIDIPDCTNEHRVAWRSSFETDGGSGRTVYVYLDDIRISIAKQQ